MDLWARSWPTGRQSGREQAAAWKHGMVPRVRGREGKTFGDEDTFIEITSSGFFIFHSR